MALEGLARERGAASDASEAAAALTRQRELEAAAERYQALLRLARSPRDFPDFSEGLDEAKLVLALAEVRLCQCQLERTAWQVATRTQHADARVRRFMTPPVVSTDAIRGGCSREAQIAKLRSDLSQVRSLYQTPVVADSPAAVQGQVRVLVETAELLAFTEEREEAITAFAEAIRLCYSIADEATEASLTERIQQLAREVDAAKLLNQLDASSTANAEKQILRAAFERVATSDGRLARTELKLLASALSAQIVLRDDEVDLMWAQMRAASASGIDAGGDDDMLTVSFSDVWRWWLTGDMMASAQLTGSRAS